jgi:hypothetical protein
MLKRTYSYIAAADWPILAMNVGAAVGVIVLGLFAHVLVFIALKRRATRRQSLLKQSITLHCTTPLRLLFPLLALDIVMPSLTIHPAVDCWLVSVEVRATRRDKMRSLILGAQNAQAPSSHTRRSLRGAKQRKAISPRLRVGDGCCGFG